MEKMDKLPNQDNIVIDPPARCVGQNINPVGTYIIGLGKVPTIISAGDSDPVDNGIRLIKTRKRNEGLQHKSTR